jgi:hypothetical protein
MDPAKKPEYTKLLLSLIPESGESVGNLSLRERLKKAVAAQNNENLTEQDYWALRDALIDEGLIEQGRGRGGSVHRTSISIPVRAEPAQPGVVTQRTLIETSLYQPFHSAITTGYVQEHRIKRFVSEITAAQGRRATGGRWTRPDLTVVAVRTYQFTPGKRVEVITFEVKPDLDTALEGVFEALAHSAFAHPTYLAVDLSSYSEDEDLPDDRIYQECGRHGVGYIGFTDPSDYDSFDIVAEARLKEPDPDEVDNSFGCSSALKTKTNSANSFCN